MTTSLPYETRYWFLRNHNLFAALNREEVEEICVISNFKTARKSEIIYFSHDEHSRIYSLK